MKPVSFVEVYGTEFSHSLFLLKISEKLMSVENMYCNESRKVLSQQVFLKFLYFDFILFLHFRI